MKKIGFELSSELYKAIKIRAIQLDKSIKDYILDLVKKDLAKKGE